MVDIHVLPFYTVTVSTELGDSDAHMTCILADSHGPEVSYDLASQLSPTSNLLLRSVYDVPVRSEPLVRTWARCAVQLPSDQQPHREGDADRVSVSVHECSGRDELEQSRLVEHLVAHRRGARLLVEFANEALNIDAEGEARDSYATSYELACHAASLLMQSWAVEAAPAIASGEDWHAEPAEDGDDGGKGGDGGRN